LNSFIYINIENNIQLKKGLKGLRPNTLMPERATLENTLDYRRCSKCKRVKNPLEFLTEGNVFRTCNGCRERAWLRTHPISTWVDNLINSPAAVYVNDIPVSMNLSSSAAAASSTADYFGPEPEPEPESDDTEEEENSTQGSTIRDHWLNNGWGDMTAELLEPMTYDERCNIHICATTVVSRLNIVYICAKIHKYCGADPSLHNEETGTTEVGTILSEETIKVYLMERGGDFEVKLGDTWAEIRENIHCC
jgi:hypothetical protein